MTYAEYQKEVVRADRERAAQAGWLALCECQPKPKDTATPAGVFRWTKRVDKKAQEIFERLI